MTFGLPLGYPMFPNIGGLWPLQADLSSSVDNGDRLDKI